MSGPPGQSIKTRVEALKHAPPPADLIVRLDNPLKQGLKQANLLECVMPVVVRLDNPLKQGLKR